MKVGVDPQDDNSVNEPLRALARMLGRMAARELAAPLSFLKTPSSAESRSVRALEAPAKGEIEGQ